jgi:hypothetical protein
MSHRKFEREWLVLLVVRRLPFAVLHQLVAQRLCQQLSLTQQQSCTMSHFLRGLIMTLRCFCCAPAHR